MTDSTGAVHYAVIVRTIRKARNADLHVELRDHPAARRSIAEARRFARALPAPGTEDEADRVVVFIELLTGVLEAFYWLGDSNGVPLNVVAREGLEPYGGLCQFAHALAQSSACNPEHLRRTA